MTRLWIGAVALLGLLPLPGRAQSPDSEVLQVVDDLFDGMRQRDEALLRKVFHPEARLMATGPDQDGTLAVRVTPAEEFIQAVVTATGETWDERTYNPSVEIDGDLASVWVEYDFYLGERFSHCGVDALHMARTESGWRIIALADTRRREGCPTR